jgi:glycosyltransferase involved in cell wall biosynthesis
MRISIHICSKDRHSELALCLQSLRTQTYQDFDVLIADESQTPIQQCHFLMSIINRLKHEGHKVEVLRHVPSQGVCEARNYLLDNDKFNNPLQARIDDDVVLDENYLDYMVIGLVEGPHTNGYDIMSGCTPHCASPVWERESRFVKPFINDIELDKKGNIKKYTDDCGYGYLSEGEIIPATNFRSNAVYKTSLIKKGVRYPKQLSKIGFREELWFSIKAILKGAKIGVIPNVYAWHIQTPSGGCRSPDYAECVKLDQETTEKWIRKLYAKHGDFIKKYRDKVRK